MKSFVKITVAFILASCMLISFCACSIGDGTPDVSETESSSVETNGGDDTGNDGATDGDNGDENDKEDDKEDDVPKVIEDKTYNIAETLSSIKTHGRTSVISEGLVCDFSSSGIEFNAYIEGALTIDIKVEQGIKVTTYDARNDDCYFTLYVDGVRSDERLMANKSADTTLTLAEFAEGGVHNIKLVRQTEARNALALLKTVSFRGYFEDKPADAEYYIEFMGASNTAGYGNLAPNSGNTANAAYAQLSKHQDSTQSYTYLTAQKLGADYSMISVSGIGLVSGSRNFPLIDAFDYSSYYRNNTTEKFVATRVPDAVVIACGSNDERTGATLTAYTQAVIDIITKVRTTYGEDVTIVWLYYTTTTSYRNAAKEAIATFGNNAGIYEIEVLFNSNGGNSHPDLASHIEGAEKLAKFIQDNNILTAEGGGNSNTDEEENAVTVTEKYLPSEVRSDLEQKFVSNVSSFLPAYASANYHQHSLQDSITVSDCKLKTISVPVYKTLEADENGMLTFTVFVHDRSLGGLKLAAKRTYTIKLDPADYGITANKARVMKYVDIDVSEYNIVLTENETIAMSAATDTIIPMRIMVMNDGVKGEDGSYTYTVTGKLLEEFPQAQGLYSVVGSSDLKYTAGMFIPYDFEWEKSYTEKELNAATEAENEYKELVELLKEKYSGKYVSILGDSISTFNGIANDETANSTIGDNRMYYDYYTNPYKWERTYWGRLIADLNMNLCVNNSWASSRVYGRESGKLDGGTEDVSLNYRDSAPARATELHRADGTTPDLIIMYMGINDLHSLGYSTKVPFGDLYDILINADESEYNELIDTWFEKVLENTSNGTALEAGTTYTSFEQAYALALYRMQVAYPEADIMIFGLENNASASFTVDRQAKFNLVIEALADYFEVMYVDQCGEYSEINSDNMVNYGMDLGCTHPNSLGHAAIERMLLKVLADFEKSKNA